jgi:hypothetical protein
VKSIFKRGLGSFTLFGPITLAKQGSKTYSRKFRSFDYCKMASGL